MGPNNSPQKAPPVNPPKPGPDSAPPQPGVKAEIVESIPVKQQANENVALDQSQPVVSPKPEAKKTLDWLKTPPKAPTAPAPPKTQTMPHSPILAITIASLIAIALTVAAFFAFRSS